MMSNLDSQARPRQAWKSLEAEWPPGKRERLADRFSILGRIGFYLQLALLTVPILLTAYVLLLRKSDQLAGIGINLGNYLSLASLLVMIFTAYWFFRYMQLGEQLKDPNTSPAQSSVVAALWVGLWAGCLGIVFSMMLLLGAAWRLLFVLLANPQSGALLAPPPGSNPAYSISALDAVSMTSLLVMLGAELVVLGMTLWLLFNMTWSRQTTDVSRRLVDSC